MSQDQPFVQAAETPPVTLGPVLTSRQRKLHEALVSKKQLAADLYFSALLALNQPDNPCRHIMAGHAIREMVNKLPEFLDIPQPDKPANIKAKVNDLKTAWDKCSASGADAWDNSVDARLQNFIKKVKQFFLWYVHEHASRYERNAALVRGLDLSLNKLPQQLEIVRVQEWQHHYDYFTGVAHLGDPTAFDQWFEALENRLLDMLIPRTFDDFEAIDELLGGGEE